MNALVRFARVMVAQALAFWVADLSGVNVPIINISAGALLNALAKYLRDKFKLDWLPV